MNHRSITTTCVAVAAALAITACGTDDDGLQAGDIDLADEASVSDADDVADAQSTATNTAVQLTDDAPDYCRTIVDMLEASEPTQDEALELYTELLEGLATDGPVELRSEHAEHADQAKALQATGIDLETSDGSDLSSEDLDILLDFVDGSLRFSERSDQLMDVFRDDCGDDLVDSFDDAPESVLIPRTNTGSPAADVEEDPEEPVFVAFTEAIDGPFGSGDVSNSTIEITDAVWSNRPPRQFHDDAAEPAPEHTDRRFLYLTVNVINDDANDAFDAAVEHFAVIGADGNAVGAEDATPGFVGPLVTALTANTRTLGFELGEVVDASTLTLRFADDAVPELIDVIAPADAPLPVYPLEVDTPLPGEFIGSNNVGCEVPWTWTVDSATILLDIPAEFDGAGSAFNARARNGERWIRLTGSMTAGEHNGGPAYLCQGNINENNLRLVVDGLGMVPLGAPNDVLGINESITLDVLWPIPTDATELAIRGVGSDGNSFESAFTLPELPAVPGE